MSKKLTTIILALLFVLIGKVDAATLTQYIGNSCIQADVDVGQEVTITFTNQINYTFKNWVVESGNVTLNTTSSTTTFTMPNADVVIRAKYQEEPTVLSDVATVGAYVTYVPSSTSYTVPTTVSGYTSDQSYNPSSTTSWRVFSNENGTVEIISADSVGDLYLTGDTGYLNGVQTLNDMSSAYVDSTYAESGRSLGYYDETRYTSETNSGSTMTETEITNYQTIDTTSYPLSYRKTGFPYSDYQYVTDKNVLSTNGTMYHSSGNIWFASRFDTGVMSSYGMRSLGNTGDIISDNLCDVVSNVTPYTVSSGVRPIVSLKSGLTVTGKGTEAEPYVINETNASLYTMTYCANGGYGEMNPQSGDIMALTANTYKHHTKVFKGWAIDATATTVTYTDGETIRRMGDTTLYAVWQDSKLIANKVNVGDYITYVPSNTSYTVSKYASGNDVQQSFTPSSTTSWRVFSNDGENVEIISADSVGTLFLTGATGYKKAVQTLNDIAAAYVNSTYATSGRSLGYYDVTRYTSTSNSGSVMTETEKASYKTISSSLSYGLSGFPYTDYQYMPDKTALANHGSMYHSSGNTWLASRDMDTESDCSIFYVRYMNTSGDVINHYLYNVYSSGNGGSNNGYGGVRPVVSLKSEITVTGGSGTEADPYIISAQ